MTEPTDPTLLQLVGVGLLNVIVGAGTWFAARRKNNAAESAEVARLEVDRVGANAETDVIQLLRDELQATRKEVSSIRAALDDERKRRWKVEEHVMTLERIMRSAGLNPPALGATEVSP